MNVLHRSVETTGVYRPFIFRNAPFTLPARAAIPIGISDDLFPANIRQQLNRWPDCLCSLEFCGVERCLGSAGPADFHLSADKPVKALVHSLSESERIYTNRFL